MRRRWLEAAIIGGTATLLALFFASQAFVVYSRPGAMQAPFHLFLTASLVEWWGWALLAPGVLWLARRFPLFRPHVWRALAVHLAALPVVTIGKVALNGAGRALVLDYPFAINPRELHTTVLTYALIVAAAHGVEIYRRWRDRELHASRVEALLAEARLKALGAQLQPHFLFNTLNAIQSLLHGDPEAADRMISHLGDLLRGSLAAADAREVPLAKELELLTPYLEIQRARFQDRLSVHIDVEPDALAARVPSLLLQPLVENAIRHGIAPRATPGTVEIRARRVDGALALEVRDDGVGIPAPPREGVGLRNTRQRLEELYAGRHSLRLEAAPGGGTVVRLSIPLPENA